MSYALTCEDAAGLHYTRWLRQMRARCEHCVATLGLTGTRERTPPDGASTGRAHRGIEGWLPQKGHFYRNVFQERHTHMGVAGSGGESHYIDRSLLPRVPVGGGRGTSVGGFKRRPPLRTGARPDEPTTRPHSPRRWEGGGDGR